jgi:RNA-directed DNA polymerase
MTHGREKSDSVIVAGKPANKAERSAAELAERRAGTEGNANQLRTRWTQSRISVTQDVGSLRQTTAVTHPRWEPRAGIPLARFCAGGGR